MQINQDLSQKTRNRQKRSISISNIHSTDKKTQKLYQILRQSLRHGSIKKQQMLYRVAQSSIISHHPHPYNEIQCQRIAKQTLVLENSVLVQAHDEKLLNSVKKRHMDIIDVQQIRYQPINYQELQKRLNNQPSRINYKVYQYNENNTQLTQLQASSKLRQKIKSKIIDSNRIGYQLQKQRYKRVVRKPLYNCFSVIDQPINTLRSDNKQSHGCLPANEICASRPTKQVNYWLPQRTIKKQIEIQ